MRKRFDDAPGFRPGKILGRFRNTDELIYQDEKGVLSIERDRSVVTEPTPEELKAIETGDYEKAEDK